jgi:hypothetical protein
MDYAKVEGHTGISRDETTGAIVNTDMKSYQLAKKRKETFLNQRNEINNLKEEIGEIKNLLTTLIERVNG